MKLRFFLALVAALGSAFTPDWSALGAPAAGDSPAAQPKPALQLQMATGRGEFFSSGKKSASGYFGQLHFLSQSKDPLQTPSLASTNRVSILASSDRTKLVMLVLDYGPLYFSTNSGTTWKIITTPGKHQFPLDLAADGSGFLASVTLSAIPPGVIPPAPNTPTQDWYAIASGSDRSKLVLGGSGVAPSPPALTIITSGTNSVLSWPATGAAFQLQQSGDLSAPNWVAVPAPVAATNGQNTVTIPTAATHVFYRLKAQ